MIRRDRTTYVAADVRTADGGRFSARSAVEARTNNFTFALPSAQNRMSWA